MREKYVLDDTSSSDQVIIIIGSILVSCFFFAFLFVGWNWGLVVMGIIPSFFYIPVNIFVKRFSNIYTDGDVFFVKNLYKKEQKIDARLFDKIVDMKTIVWYPNNPYYTIYFKNGMKFDFAKKKNSFPGFPMRDKEQLAEELTKEVKDFLSKAAEV